jgi:hypothetical protein
MNVAASGRLKSSKLPADCRRLQIISLRRGEECGERNMSSWGGDVRWGAVGGGPRLVGWWLDYQETVGL